MIVVVVERRWIASSNAEWGVLLPTGWARGGSLAAACAKAAGEIDFVRGGTIQIRPDTTAEQARRANAALFGQ